MFRLKSVIRAGLELVIAGSVAALAQTVPLIVTNVPANGSVDVSPSASVVITFSLPMNTAVTTVQFFNSSVPPPNGLPVVRTWNLEGTRLTNTPSPAFPSGKAITWFATGMDLQGNPLGPPFSGAFLTAAGSGPTPQLLSVVPTNHATEVPTNTAAVFTFSVAMNTNLTAAQFNDLENPSVTPFTIPSWNEQHTILTCTPSPGFPAGQTLVWNLQGVGAEGGAFPGGGGTFTTLGSGGSGGGSPVTLISRGESGVQVNAGDSPSGELEFVAFSSQGDAGTLTVISPAATTNLLTQLRGSDIAQALARNADATAFRAAYPAGAYRYEVTGTNGMVGASMPLAESGLPGVARLSPWMDPPRVILGEELILPWAFSSGSAAVDHVRVEIRQGSQLLFSSPLPGAGGALTGASNRVVIPATAFSREGTAEVSLSTFHITATETNAIPGLTLHAARHRTTRFALRVVPGNALPPTIRFKRFPGIPVQQSVMYTLGPTNGVRPLRIQRIAGSFPPGLDLDEDGSLIGTATAQGNYEASVLVTDLLGQASVETVSLTTTALPAFPTPTLENVRYTGGSQLQVDLVGGAGVECRVERSANLLDWTPHLTTNPPSARITFQVAAADEIGFLRVRGPGSRPPSNPIRVTPIPASGAKVSGDIGLFGGTLSLTNAAGWIYSLEIPAGALGGTETLTLTDLTRVDGLPFAGGLRAGVELRPAGLLFDTPVTLRITSPSALDPAADLGFHALTDGREFALVPHVDADRTASFHLLYLATVGVARGTVAEVQTQLSHAPDDPILAVGQEAAAIRFACAQGNCDAITLGSSPQPQALQARNLGPHGDPPGNKAVESYIRTAKQVIIPQLQTASESEDDGTLDNALLAWRGWLKELQTLGLADSLTGEDQEGELAACLQSAAGLAARGIWNGMTRSCQQCLDHDLARIGRTESLARTAGMMGWSFDTYYFDCAQRCLHFELQIESLMIYSGSTGTYLTDTKAKIELKPWEEDWYNILFGGGYKGEATWEVKNVEDWDSKCPVTSSPTSGEANVAMMRLKLFQQRCDYIPGQGLVLHNTYYPDLRIYLLANKDKMPKEGRVSHCPKDEPRKVADVFGPAFLSIHAKITETPEVIGEPCVRLDGFETVGAGDVVFRKQYVETEVVKDGYVEERTTLELVHKPQ